MKGEGNAGDDRMLLPEGFVHPWWFVGRSRGLARLAKWASFRNVLVGAALKGSYKHKDASSLNLQNRLVIKKKTEKQKTQRMMPSIDYDGKTWTCK